MTARDIAVVLVAAGDGQRLGAGIPKAFATVGGRTLLERALFEVSRIQGLKSVAIALPEDPKYMRLAQDFCSQVGLEDAHLVYGGSSRQGSIAAGLSALAPTNEIVLVHDAARALAPTALFEAVAASVRETGHASVPMLPVADTIKKLDGEAVLETVDRSTLGAAQTPQGFTAESIRRAYDGATSDFTDDAALVQSMGASVRAVAGHPMAFKVTTPADLERAEQLLNSREVRTGIGTDTHRFTRDKRKPLYLGTVEWPGERGLDGHSDGDAVSHAIVDALLSAAGLGDIGSNFGVDRKEFAGANGSVFLAETKRLLTIDGWVIENVSVQVIGNRPKIGPHRARVQIALSRLLDTPVSLSATTTDGLGFLGKSKGVAAVATALISRPKDRLQS